MKKIYLYMLIVCLNLNYIQSQNHWNLGENGINAVKAWNITKGSPDIKVAIIDNGILLNDALLQSNLVQGYTSAPYSSGFGEAVYCEVEGTCAASIIAAISTQSHGDCSVAPNCKLIPIKARVKRLILTTSSSSPVYDFFFSEESIEQSLIWAINIGNADVINFSWDFDHPWNSILSPPISPNFENVFTTLINNARGGKGIPVIVSAGNSGNASVAQPAYFEGVICVGAIDTEGKRMDIAGNNHGPDFGPYLKSNYGEDLDIMAPGENIATPAGYTNFYVTNATYSAAAHVSGVVALMLSVNPNLTAVQVKKIIEMTARKTRPDIYAYTNTSNRPNGTWCLQMGYGCVDAYAAVRLASCYNSDTETLATGNIANSTTWNTNMYAYGTIRIKSGATLTISSQVRCDSTAQIIVEPGGHLLVNGGTLTNACSGKMWQGIIVEGNSSLNQDISSYQGRITLQNGAIIENAVTAISTCASPKSGGVISATNTTFKNNATAVKIYPYSAYSIYYGSELLYNGDFTLCNFIADNNGLQFSEHVNLSGVNGIQFRGCSFQKTGTSANPYMGGPYAIAINAHNSGFSVNEYCGTFMTIFDCYCPATPTRSSFSGFNTAISIGTSGTQKNITINNAIFSNFYSYAISISDMNNVRVTRSDFVMNNEIGDYSPTGIKLWNATGYKIEENYFYGGAYNGNSLLVPSRTGVYVYNSGAIENSIYRNRFENITIGISANGNNGYPLSTSTPGLQITCNEFRGGRVDIQAALNNYIRFKQGEQGKGADNDFINTYNTSLSSFYEINYFKSNQSYHDPLNVNQNKVYIIPGATANNCASTLCTITIGPFFGPQAPKSSPLVQYDQLRAKMADQQSLYKNAKEDKSMINMAEKKETISNAENAISSLSLQMNEISQTAIYEILDDTTNVDLSQLTEWYSRMPATSADYALAETYYQMGEYALANSTLDAMFKKYDFGDVQMLDYDNYNRFHALKNTLQATDRYWDALTNEEIDELVSIAEASDERSSTMAKGILCFFYNICYEDEIIAKSDPVLPLPKSAPMESTVPATSDIQVFPNPVADNLTVSIPVLPKGAVIFQLVDVNGRIMLTQALTSDYSTINLSNLPNGIYQYQILHNGISLKSDKVVKQ